MRRKRSDELPRFANEPRSTSFRWRRRWTYYLLCAVAVCWFLLPRSPAWSRHGDGTGTGVNWNDFAYSLYAIDGASLCHAVLIFDALARLGSKADRVLFYPNTWDTTVHSSKDRDSQLLVLARDAYKVKLQPTKLLTVQGRNEAHRTGNSDKSVTKFMAFSLGYYDRVIALDSDVTLLQSIDELFLLPATPIAMPRAYWADMKPWPLSSMLMVIKPNEQEFESFKKRIMAGGDDMLVRAHRVDMELVNERFEENAMVLPHRPYALITGEFARHNHSEYMGDPEEVWDAEKIYAEAKLVHFSDYPLPPPWIMWTPKALEEMQPNCGGSHDKSCAERRIWKQLYDDFRRRRRDVCKLLSVPAPDWESIRPESPVERFNSKTESSTAQLKDTASSNKASSPSAS